MKPSQLIARGDIDAAYDVLCANNKELARKYDKVMLQLRNITNGMTPEPQGYYGHHHGCDCAVCEDIDIRESLKETNKNTLTCVYCGTAYPEGTPPHGSQILTDHIKVCEKHPLRAAEATILKLRSALSGLVGANSKEELETMASAICLADAPARDKTVIIDAIHVLLETA